MAGLSYRGKRFLHRIDGALRCCLCFGRGRVFLDDIDRFDAGSFGISPRERLTMGLVIGNGA